MPEDVTVTLPDGRTIAVAVTGPSGGPAVVFLHAAPGSRRFDPDPAATAAARVRLVTLDRAGYGASAPLPDGAVPTIAGYADDVAAVIDALALDDVVVVGWSAGGRIAAAVAARHPDVVRAVGVVATPAPDDVVPWIPDEHRPMLDAMRADPAAGVRALVDVFAGADAPADPAAVTGGRHDDAVAAMLAEAFAPGPIGVALDIVSYSVVPWGFDPRAVGVPVACVYGDADPIVPPAHGEWWVRQFVDADLTIVPGADHLVVRDAWPSLLARWVGAERH